MNLLPHHHNMLEDASAIAPNVSEARGCRSITTRADLARLGFAASQQSVPTLLLPIWSAAGEISLYHHRPDEARLRDGKPVKYEFPSKAKMAVDVHPFVKEKVRDPTVPLFITEGTKKADAAISRGLCCIAVIGTWNWRGTNEWGGKTALPDWDGIAFKNQQDAGRITYICYDSDVMLKPPVHLALVRLSAFLKQRGAAVAYIYLPPGPGGEKVGLDDYFAAGHTVDDLMQLATTELREPPSDREAAQDGAGQHLPYEETPRGLVHHRRIGEAPVPCPLTNFTARIAADVVEDDGAETRRVFEIEAKLNGNTYHFSVPGDAFAAMNWHTAQLGAKAILYPGQSVREHARTAIQCLSDAAEQRVYTHTGWAKFGERWGYCHAGGVIGSPADATTLVRLPEHLARFSFPFPPQGEELPRTFAALLRLWKMGREELVLPVCGAVFRAALGTTDFSLFLAGQTGVFKSEIAALAQQHYGAGMDARHLPADWSSTENALEGIAFSAKDALLVIDEFVPRGSVHDQQRHHAKADRVLRAQGNNAGRGRMRADGSLRPAKPPRGLILATGEDIPPGQSLRARQFVIEVSPGDIPANSLSVCQKDAAAGLYAQVMAAFIAYLAPQYDVVQNHLRREIEALRNEARGTASHRRTPEIVASLAVGWKYFLRFAVAEQLLTAQEGDAWFKRAWKAIGRAAEQQARFQEDSEPTGRYRELLSAALASGRAHVAAPNGEAPVNPQAFGWREVRYNEGEYERLEWRAQGERIGWVEDGDLYLIPDAALHCVQRMGESGGSTIALAPKTLNKRLKERGLLQTTDEQRGTLTIRKVLAGSRQTVLHLRTTDVVSGKTDQSAQPDKSGGKDPAAAVIGQLSGADCEQ